MNAQCIMICSGKGGTGKSTVSVLLGAGLARLGRKELLVELEQPTTETAIITASTIANVLFIFKTSPPLIFCRILVVGSFHNLLCSPTATLSGFLNSVYTIGSHSVKKQFIISASPS